MEQIKKGDLVQFKSGIVVYVVKGTWPATGNVDLWSRELKQWRHGVSASRLRRVEAPGI